MVFKKFGPDKNMQLYDRGIRRRLAPMLGGDRRRLELAYSLMCTLPGTPVIRYGDEIGMGDNLDLPERNCARTPMQWSTEPHAGFTESDKPCSPVIDKGPYGYEHVNVAKQRRDPNSMLNWTERIIRMRKEVPEVGWGDFKVIATRDPAVLVIRYDWRNNSVLFVHNLDEKPREISFAVGLPGDAGKLLVNLLTRRPQPRQRKPASTRCCSKPTAIAGIASEASIICSSAATSTSTRRARPAIRREVHGLLSTSPREAAGGAEGGGWRGVHAKLALHADRPPTLDPSLPRAMRVEGGEFGIALRLAGTTMIMRWTVTR